MIILISILKTIALLFAAICLFSALSACSSLTPYQKRTYECMERVMDLGSNATAAYEICEKMDNKR